MGHKVEWTKSALADAGSAIEYIQRDSPVYAQHFKRQLGAVVETLHQFPERGRVVPELEFADVRELIFGSYRVIYVIRDETVFIAAFLHGARNLTAAKLKTKIKD